MNDELPICPNDCGVMIPQYENNGFEPPEGAPHYELTHYRCPVCGAESEGDPDGEE